MESHLRELLIGYAQSPEIDVSHPRQKAMLSAAETIVREEGFEGLSLRKVAAASGVKLPSVQYHFGTKSGLVNALVNQSFQRYCTQLFGLLEKKPSSAQERLDQAIDFLLGTLNEPPGVEIHLWAFALYDDNAAAQKERYFSLYREFLFELIRDCGQISDQNLCRQRAAQIVALVEGFYLMISGEVPVDLKEYHVEMRNTIRALSLITPGEK